MDKEILKYILVKRVPKWIGIGLMILFFLAGFFFMFKAFTSKIHPVLSVYFLFCGLACGITSSLFFIRICLTGGTQWVINSIFAPKSYLKKAAVLLTPIQGMIASGKYKEAESALLALHEKAPGDPEITVILMELYSDQLHDPYCAARTAALYFQYSPQRTNVLHIRILMEYADILGKLGKTADLQDLYKSQLQYGNLTLSEIKAVNLRLKNM